MSDILRFKKPEDQLRKGAKNFPRRKDLRKLDDGGHPALHLVRYLQTCHLYSIAHGACETSDFDTLSIEQAGGEAKTIAPKAIPMLRYFSGLNFPKCKKARWLRGRQNFLEMLLRSRRGRCGGAGPAAWFQ